MICKKRKKRMVEIYYYFIPIGHLWVYIDILNQIWSGIYILGGSLWV